MSSSQINTDHKRSGLQSPFNLRILSGKYVKDSFKNSESKLKKYIHGFNHSIIKKAEKVSKSNVNQNSEISLELEHCEHCVRFAENQIN